MSIPRSRDLLQEGCVTYHRFADREQVTATRQGLIVAAIILLLPAVPALGCLLQGRGVGSAMVVGESPGNTSPTNASSSVQATNPSLTASTQAASVSRQHVPRRGPTVTTFGA